MTNEYEGINKEFIISFVKREIGQKIFDPNIHEHIILYPFSKFLDEIGYEGRVIQKAGNNNRKIEEQLNFAGPADWFFKVSGKSDDVYSIKMIKKDVWYLKNNN